MKPMLAPPRHSSTPTCTRFNGACAWAPVKDAMSRVTATPARMDERRMKKSPADECDATREEEREERRERAVAPGAVFSMPQHWRLCHICGGHPRLKQRPSASNKKGPLTRAFSVNNLSVSNLRSFSRAAQR